LTLLRHSGRICDMRQSPKTSQMQIRVSAQEKAAIRRAAKRAGMDMSSYVLERVLSLPARRFRDLVEACAGPGPTSFPLAELNSLLSGFTAAELREAIAAAPAVTLTPFLANYIAAMVEYACERRALALPAWTRAISPLSDPAFGTALQALRLHLLSHSPPPFRRRNIFIDATLGNRI
jgi:hypothetical protein